MAPWRPPKFLECQLTFALVHSRSLSDSSFPKWSLVMWQPINEWIGWSRPRYKQPPRDFECDNTPLHPRSPSRCPLIRSLVVVHWRTQFGYPPPEFCQCTVERRINLVPLRLWSWPDPNEIWPLVDIPGRQNVHKITCQSMTNSLFIHLNFRICICYSSNDDDWFIFDGTET